MVCSFGSLPPEILLDILDWLPRGPADPAFAQAAAEVEDEGGEPLAEPGLVTTATLNKRLGALSQQLLFAKVSLQGKEQIKHWTTTDARRWTAELRVAVDSDDFRGRGGNDWAWLGDMVGSGLEGKDGVGGRWLEVLELEGVREGELGKDWCDVKGLLRLTALLVSFPLPPSIAPTSFTHLRHLHLDTDGPFDAPFPFLPAVTHLTLHYCPRAPHAFTASFPALEFLAIGYLHLCLPTSPASLTAPRATNDDTFLAQLAAHPPTRLTRFATRHYACPAAVLARLPATVVEFRFEVRPSYFRKAEAPAPREEGWAGVVGRMRRLTVVGMREADAEAQAQAQERGDVAEAARLVAELEAAGCEVVHE